MRQWVRSLCAGLLLGVVALATAPLRADGTPDADAAIVPILRASVSTLDSSIAPQEVNLPSRTLRVRRTFQRYRLDADFELPSPLTEGLWAVYIVHFSHGGTLSVNGVEVGTAPTSSAQTTLWHTRPYLFPLPAALLRPGLNHLQVNWAEAQSLSMLSRIFVGPIDTLTPHYQARYFWQNTMAGAALVHALVIAAILLGIYSLRRHQQSYLLMGLGAIGFSVIVFTYMLPPMPSWLYPYWRFVHIGGIAVFTSCAWLFLVHESQPRNRWFPRLCIAWALLGPLVYLMHFWLTDQSYYKAFEPWWGIVSGLLGLFPVGALLHSLRREWAWRKLIFIVVTSFAIVMGVADMVLQSTSTSLLGNVGYSLQAVSPLWFTALTGVLVSDFVASLTEQEGQRQLMRQRLAEQQAELTRLHESHREREREKATQQERQRIMQDMHDGLGSLLLATLALNERGALSKELTSQMLRECIDDLRLAIDSMATSECAFGLGVGNLRFRMEPRLRAVGIELAWDSRGFASDTNVPAHKTLPLLRIMQEAISNALNHAQATVILIRLQSSPTLLCIQICDNGQGFDAERARAGMGINGMEKRARGIGATLAIDGRAAHGGTLVRVHLPLDGSGCG